MYELLFNIKVVAKEGKVKDLEMHEVNMAMESYLEFENYESKCLKIIIYKDSKEFSAQVLMSSHRI